MRTVVLGSGGREHAIFLKLLHSPTVTDLYFAPGNGGAGEKHRFPADILNFPELEKIFREKNIELLVVGPEAPLAAGIVDYFAEKMPELLVFGPDENGAQLEASKLFSSTFMDEAGIPQAKSRPANDLTHAKKILAEHPLPVVIKADGLAAGKGVSIHQDRNEAEQKLEEIFNDKIFGEAGMAVLFQEFLQGKEASLFAICNGKDAVYLPSAQDYKRAYDGQTGPNTGGMGSFSPGNILNKKHIEFVHNQIVKKVIEKFQYKGILYVGLMIDNDDISVVEFNCRLGDPETQSVMPMLETDLLPYLTWAAGKSNEVFTVLENGYRSAPQKPGYTINVVLTAKGYPGNYNKGIELPLPENIPEYIHIVHAGTKTENGKLVSTGGRIMSIVCYDKNPAEARKKVYNFIDSIKDSIDFEKLHFRTDIGL
ncbi:MAG: phosphoribosylamine--glycine ligase [Leptospirales bacterium]